MDILNVQKMTSQSKKSERQNAVKGFVEQRLRVSAERCTVAVVSVKQSFALRRETGTSSVFSAGCGIEQLEAQWLKHFSSPKIRMVRTGLKVCSISESYHAVFVIVNNIPIFLTRKRANAMLI